MFEVGCQVCGGPVVALPGRAGLLGGEVGRCDDFLVARPGLSVEVGQGQARLRVADHQELVGLDVAATGRLHGGPQAGPHIVVGNRFVAEPSHGPGGHDSIEQWDLLTHGKDRQLRLTGR